jgi:hypothetical protein
VDIYSDEGKATSRRYDVKTLPFDFMGKEIDADPGFAGAKD